MVPTAGIIVGAQLFPDLDSDLRFEEKTSQCPKPSSSVIQGYLEAPIQLADVYPHTQPGYAVQLEAKDMFGLSIPHEVRGHFHVRDAYLIRGLSRKRMTVDS